MIYLDSAATTKTDPVVIEKTLPYFSECYANPGSVYGFGRSAKEAVRNARDDVAKLFGCSRDDVLFTSGGSESNSMAIRSATNYLKDCGKTHILVSAVEHSSILRATNSLGYEGFHIQKIPVTRDCVVSLSVIEKMISQKTGLISVMYVNNETGTVNPVGEIGALCAERGILFHTDCVQAAGGHVIDVKNIGCDFATISGHKIHGMKGTGAIYVRNKMILDPLIYGGSRQEYGLRGGTENVPGIVSIGAACKLCYDRMEENIEFITSLKKTFFEQLKYNLSAAGIAQSMHINGPGIDEPGKILNIRFDGVDGETLVLMLDAEGVCVSAGSACNSYESKPSHVLLEMGLSENEARSSVRISFSRMNNTDEVVEAARIFANCVCTLRGFRGE